MNKKTIVLTFALLLLLSMFAINKPEPSDSNAQAANPLPANYHTTIATNDSVGGSIDNSDFWANITKDFLADGDPIYKDMIFAFGGCYGGGFVDSLPIKDLPNVAAFSASAWNEKSFNSESSPHSDFMGPLSDKLNLNEPLGTIAKKTADADVTNPNAPKGVFKPTLKYAETTRFLGYDVTYKLPAKENPQTSGDTTMKIKDGQTNHVLMFGGDPCAADWNDLEKTYTKLTAAPPNGLGYQKGDITVLYGKGDSMRSSTEKSSVHVDGAASLEELKNNLQAIALKMTAEKYIEKKEETFLFWADDHGDQHEDAPAPAPPPPNGEEGGYYQIPSFDLDPSFKYAVAASTTPPSVQIPQSNVTTTGNRVLIDGVYIGDLTPLSNLTTLYFDKYQIPFSDYGNNLTIESNQGTTYTFGNVTINSGEVPTQLAFEAPTTGPIMNTIQYRFFGSPESLFTALQLPDSAGGVDLIDYPLTGAQYKFLSNNTGICVSPLPGASEFELAFNNNYTNSAHPNGRSAMNYTDFREAMACLVDKQGVIAGPTLQGFATRDDTEIPNPLMAGYINPSVSYPNYPWEFNVTKALDILYVGGWYSHTVYPTFADLLSTYTSGALASAGGTTNGVVYSGNDPHGQWGGNDRKATANAALANQPIAPLVGYVRSNDARKDLGDFFCKELRAIGVPFVETYCATYSSLSHFVMENNNPYDFATLGYSMSSPPNWWYRDFTPAGIYSGGDNPYLVDDANMTHYAYACYTDPSQAQYMSDLMAVQDILVNEAYLVSVYSPASYCAYKTGLLGMTNILGYGFQGQDQLLNWVTMICKKNNTIAYTGDPTLAPDSNIIYYGTLMPDMVNPIFNDLLQDSQISDEIFTYPLATNPYDTMVPGSALTGNPAGGDLPWMAYAWKTGLIPDPTGGTGQWTNVTLWFRNDITWHDGYPFTVADVNYTIYVNALYGDSSNNAAARLMANASNGYTPYFTAWDPYTCSILVSSASWLNLYMPNFEIVPEHLYQYIVPSNITAAEEGLSTDGLHGIWPGQAATSDNFLPNSYGITYANVADQITGKPDYTLIGTGPWKYQLGSTNAASLTKAGGGITLNAYNDPFFLTVAPGAIAFKYTWLNTSPSQQPSGGYYKIGLPDLVLLANAYGTTGTPPSTVSISGVPGQAHTWNPGADLAGPSGVIGLSDMVTLALHYGWYYGNYSYNAPYPPSEIYNGGP